MLVTKLRLVALALLMLGSVAVGASFVAQAIPRQAGKPDLRSSDANVDAVNPQPAPGRMFVVGRVLDPNGKPVPNASVLVYARPLAFKADFPANRAYPKELGRTTSDGLGRIRADVAPSGRLRTMGSAWSRCHPVMARAGPSSIPTPSNQPRTSRFVPNKSSTGGCLILPVSLLAA